MTTPPTILVVDDEPDISLALGDLLGNEGYQVEVVETGKEALRRVSPTHPYSAAILDLGLPDIDGLKVLQRLHTQDETLPVIILTAHGDQKEKIATLRRHAFAHLIKPYDRPELIEMVHRAVAVKNLALKAAKTEQALTLSETQRQLEQQRTHTLLSESEVRLNLALKAGNMGIWDWHIPTNHIIWSDEVAGIFGLTPGRFDGTYKAYINCIHPEDRPMLEEAIRKTLQNEAPYEIEHRIVYPSGEVRWVNCKGQVIKDQEGRPQRMLGTVQDISLRKQAELDLVERNRMLALDVDVTTVINQNEEIQGLLQGCTQALVRHLEAAFARIWCLDETKQELKLCASAGLYTHLDGPHGRVPVGKYKIGLIAAERKPILTNTVIGDSRVPEQEWAKREGLVSFAGYPLLRNQKVLGVMALFARHPLTEFTLKSLGMVADRITVALDRKVVTDEKNKLMVFNQRLLASVGEGIYCLDLEGNTTFVNPAVMQMTGYGEDELLGQSQHAILHHSKPDGSPYPPEKCPIYAVLRNGSVQHVDTEVFWRKDGSSFPVQYTSTPIRNDHGEIEGAVVTFCDITDRKKAEKALQESEERFKLMSEAIPQQVWTARPDGSLDFVNQRVIEYFGCPFNEMIGHGWQRFLHPEDLPGCLERWAKARETNLSYEIEFRLLRGKDHSFRWHLGRALPICNQEGQVVKWFGTNTDITQFKQLEHQVRQSQKMEAIGTLAGGIAHDFNNILMGVVGYTELAMQKVGGNEVIKRNLDEVLIAGKRAKELVQQILTFSRQTEPERQPLELQLVVKEACKFLRASLPATIEIRQNFTEAPTMILGDPTQMHQVVMNLCANSGHAMRESGGLLEVKLDHVAGETDGIRTYPDLKGGRYVCLTVQDNGAGMTPEVAQRIFDPFFTTKEVGEGTGMGLSVVHGIVTSHGGFINVESEPGQGTTFNIYFPEMEGSGVQEEDNSLPQDYFLGRGHILFVEDEEPLAKLGKEAITGLGYEVMVRTSSVEALETFRADPFRFDAVVTDQTMPNITGEALARELLRIRPDVPIILCTGFSHSMTPEKAKAMGIRAFLLKPLLIKDLGRVLREILQS